MKLLLLAAAMVTSASAAQEVSAGSPVLEYTGKPVQVPYQCTEDDISWAGLSCSDEEPCPVYLELTAVESVGNRIFLAGNIHSATITLYSVVLASEDAGKTWREVHPRSRGAGLDHIQFIDFETGWISGQALSPLPQDPFLLITNDGGKTWRQSNLFSESRVGSILQFWFSAKNSGSLVIDRGQGSDGSRYELYESPNAGETWMVRETSEKPLKLRRAPPPGTSGWRITPDAASKSFRIERQGAGERWSVVAAFSVPIGVCKPPARKEAPEPEPADATPAPAPPSPPRPVAPPSLKRPPK